MNTFDTTPSHRRVRIMTHERIGRVLAGLSVLASIGLALWSPWFLLAAAGTAVNLLLSGITDRCAVKDLLVRMGVPGERDLGRAEALADEPRAMRTNRVARLAEANVHRHMAIN